MHDVTIELDLDPRYFAEFHEEWIAALGRGWRIDRVMIPTAVLGGIALATTGAVRGALFLLVPGLMFCAFGLLELVKSKRKRAAWLRRAQSLPRSGQRLRLAVEHGALVQTDLSGDVPRIGPSAELIDTPNGYLLRFEQRNGSGSPGAEGHAYASVYIPHRRVRPAMTRHQFRALLKKTPVDRT
ncbi:MAG: hypothetical protein AAF721_38275 [Myxococcota bacterium]